VGIVWVAGFAAGLGAVLLLAQALERAVQALQQRWDSRRIGTFELPEIVGLGAAGPQRSAAPVRLLTVRHVGLQYKGGQAGPDAPYAMALLDGGYNGVLISTAEGTSEAAARALPIHAGRVTWPLEPWESAAVREAIALRS